MKSRTKTILSFSLMIACLMPGVAGAANESVSLSMEASPIAGGLYREAPRPVSASLDIDVSVPQGSASVTPMINSKVTFPREMDFYPDPRKTPVCPESKVGPQSSLASGVARIVDLCPRSVIGTGRARIHLARSANIPTLDDPELVIFNAGRTSQGRPKITIYGYSKQAGSGVLMTGFLDLNGELNIAIGVLPFDSSIADFTLGIPGDQLNVDDAEQPDGTREVVGRDPGYLRATCGDGRWDATGKFVFATRDESNGELTSDPVEVASNPFSLSCTGEAGRPVLRAPELLGVSSYKPGTKRTLKFSIANTGTASAKNLRLAVSGAGFGSSRVKSIAPGRSRVVPVKVSFPKKAKKLRVLKLSVTGNGIVKKSNLRVSRKG